MNNSISLRAYIEHKLASRKAGVVVMCSMFAVVVFLYLLSFSVKYSDVQARKDASGFEHHYANRFFYFYYYTGFFPLATLDTNLIYRKAAALQEIEENGQDLIMEYKHWSRLGEHARIWCYLPKALMSHTAWNPSVRMFNALFLLLGLLSLYRGFHQIHKPILGLLLCTAILATPFFHYEVFRNENIFALQASVFFIVLGMLLPFLFSSMTRIQSGITICAAAVLIACCSEIRNEISVVLVSAMLLVILSECIKPFKKLFLTALMIIFFAGSKMGIQYYFDQKFRESKQLVSAKGGHVYTGPRISGHRFWHPVFCGLGDYDRKYGYQWNDTVAYNYAVPLLNGKFNLDLKYSGKLHTDNYYDSAHHYYVKFDEIPLYEQVVKEKVISDIRNDPFWYLSILCQRVIKLCVTTLPFPFLGFAAIVCCLFFIRRKQWLYFKLLIICLPLSATALMIYSGRGATYNSVFGFMVLSLILYEMLGTFKIKNAAID